MAWVELEPRRATQILEGLGYAKGPGSGRQMRAGAWAAFGVATVILVAVARFVGLYVALFVLALAAVAAILIQARAFRWAPITFGLLGGAVAIPSAIQALVQVGSDPSYAARLGMGWSALVMAFAASFAPIGLRGRPRLVALVTFVAGVGGILTINLFYINTFYVLGFPFWLVAAAVAVFAPGDTNRPT